MFFWFIGTAIVTVGYVFRDPRFDYRLLVIGSVLPLLDGVIEAVADGVWVLHSVTTAIVVLAVLMVATTGRKPIRKTLLGLPIGMFLHLVFSGAWNDTAVFWWPFTSRSVDDAPFPLAGPGVVSVILEVIGLAVCTWLWRQNSLGDEAHRRRFLQAGHLRAVPG